MTKRIPLVTTETTEMLFENKKSYEKKEKVLYAAPELTDLKSLVKYW